MVLAIWMSHCGNSFNGMLMVYAPACQWHVYASQYGMWAGVSRCRTRKSGKGNWEMGLIKQHAGRGNECEVRRACGQAGKYEEAKWRQE